MTPAQVETAARRTYNSESSSFWSQDELFKVIYEGEQILATEALAIEAKDTSTSTVAGTQSYSIPSGFIAIKRIEYAGNKLKPINFREDDVLTLNNSASTSQGTPQYYYVWNDTIYLRPIPAAVGTLTIYGNKEATLLTTASSTLSVPAVCHTALVDFVRAMMAAKDENWTMYDRFNGQWEKHISRLRAWFKKRKRTDGFATVQDEETRPETMLGFV